MTRRGLLTLVLALALSGLPSLARAGIGPVVTCCMVTCEDPGWTACGLFIECPSGACASTPTQDFGPGTCGDGDFASCPADESGQCADGVNNDEYRNTVTDCDDPACATDPACAPPTATPTATATPVPSNDDDDGCQIVASHSKARVLFFAPFLLLLWRRRTALWAGRASAACSAAVPCYAIDGSPGMLLQSVKRLVRRSPRLTRALGTAYRLLAGPFPGSQDYWIKRYAKGGNSGPGSYSELAQFKARVLNDFVREKQIASVIEFGCGDGNQLVIAEYPRYTGFDVSPVAVERCRARFASDATKSFGLLRDHAGQTADMAMSLDVIYHLVEDAVFEAHLRSVFGAATRYVVVYSTNRDAPDDAGLAHIRHRRFSDFVERALPAWKLVKNEKQPNAYSGDITSSSLAEFFFFEKS